MTTLNVYRAEGRIDDPIFLNQISSIEFDNLEAAKFELQSEISLSRRNGAEVEVIDDTRAYIIDESNNVSKIFDID